MFVVAAALTSLALLAACSDSKKPSAAQSSSSGHSGAAAGSNNSSSSSTASLSTDSSGKIVVPTTAPLALVACDLFDMSKFNAASGETWTGVKSRGGQDCIFVVAGQNKQLTVKFLAARGLGDNKLADGQRRCTKDTVQPQTVADGGYVCLVQGQPEGALLIKSKDALGSLTSSRFGSAAASDVAKLMVQLLQSYVPPT